MSHKYDNLRKILHDACELKAIEDLALMPSDEEIAKIHEFSPEFERRMENMIKECFACRTKAKKAITRKRHLTTIKKFAAAAAVFVAFTFSCAMSVEAIREAFVSYLINIYDDHFKIAVSPDVTAEMIVDYYEPTWVPNGYKELSRNQDLTINQIKYVNESNIIIFMQMTLSQNYLVDYDPATSTVVEVPNFGNYISSEEHSYLVWTDEKYSYVITADLSLEDMLHIVDSLEIDI